MEDPPSPTHGLAIEVIQQVTPLGLTVRLQPPGGGPVSREFSNAEFPDVFCCWVFWGWFHVIPGGGGAKSSQGLEYLGGILIVYLEDRPA